MSTSNNEINSLSWEDLQKSDQKTQLTSVKNNKWRTDLSSRGILISYHQHYAVLGENISKVGKVQNPQDPWRSERHLVVCRMFDALELSKDVFKGILSFFGTFRDGNGGILQQRRNRRKKV